VVAELGDRPFVVAVQRVVVGDQDHQLRRGRVHARRVDRRVEPLLRSGPTVVVCQPSGHADRAHDLCPAAARGEVAQDDLTAHAVTDEHGSGQRHRVIAERCTQLLERRLDLGLRRNRLEGRDRNVDLARHQSLRQPRIPVVL